MRILLLSVLQIAWHWFTLESKHNVNRWTVKESSDWYFNLPEWIVGCNFLPSSASNQFEMWQAESFDVSVIEKELGFASRIGFNTIRVYLHDQIFNYERDRFLQRIDYFLSIAKAQNLSTILVFFDDCHRPDPKYGLQPSPIKGVHNSVWKQSPGTEVVKRISDNTASVTEINQLREYIVTVLTRFAHDERILMWDIYNEPGRGGNEHYSLRLLQLTWDWAQSVRPSQPLTSCLDGSIGKKIKATNLARSDVITFHEYDGQQLERTLLRVQSNARGRPVICTEYMAREFGTTFHHSLPIFHSHDVGCISWGLVAGRSQTHFNWATIDLLQHQHSNGNVLLQRHDAIPEPVLWFHDIFRADGSPFDPEEVLLIRNFTASSRHREPRILTHYDPEEDDDDDEELEEVESAAEVDVQMSMDGEAVEASETAETALARMTYTIEFTVLLFGRSLELYLEREVEDVHLQHLGVNYVTSEARAFCISHASVFGISEAALERGCAMPLFNQLMVQINAKRDEAALKSQQDNERQLEWEREDELQHAKEFIITASDGRKYRTYFDPRKRKARFIAAMFCQRTMKKNSSALKTPDAVLLCVEPIQAQLEKQTKEYFLLD
mmetsp:Transcript_24791/g.35606  ORF Transcript_24791/g.35606 Transcript_24791/m.35606 type:complete len:610 (-) Transcript_24791:217-2046(-)